jgi:hypothetical protein
VKQTDQIRRIGAALARAGFRGLDAKAKALGLPRSTTWTILQSTHKTSGLSVATVRRMLASPQLPAAVRAAILAYVAEKTTGTFGHHHRRRRQFATRLAGDGMGEPVEQTTGSR